MDAIMASEAKLDLFGSWGWSLMVGSVALVQAVGEVAAVSFLCFVGQKYPTWRLSARRICFFLIAGMNAFVGSGQQQSGSPAEKLWTNRDFRLDQQSRCSKEGIVRLDIQVNDACPRKGEIQLLKKKGLRLTNEEKNCSN